MFNYETLQEFCKAASRADPSFRVRNSGGRGRALAAADRARRSEIFMELLDQVADHGAQRIVFILARLARRG